MSNNENLLPRKVDNIEAMFNRSSYFTEGTLSLLKTNLNDWFILAEYKGDEYLSKANIYDASSRYWKVKLKRTQNLDIEYRVQRSKRKRQAILAARVIEKE